MGDYDRCKAVIVVFVMDGCHFCDEYKPRLDRMIQVFQSSGAPIVYHDGNSAIMPGQIPVLTLDGASQDPQVVAFANQHKVDGMPTTIVLMRYGRPIKHEGALEDREIYDMLVGVVLANR